MWIKCKTWLQLCKHLCRHVWVPKLRCLAASNTLETTDATLTGMTRLLQFALNANSLWHDTQK